MMKDNENINPFSKLSKNVIAFALKCPKNYISTRDLFSLIEFSAYEAF